MKRQYNQSRDLQTRKRKYNPDFWEIPVEHEALYRFSEEDGPWHETPEEMAYRARLSDYVKEMMPTIRTLMGKVLTERQHDIVHLYFFEQKTQHEVAELLGISVSSVSQHLFGKRREGKVVGGAIPKLRKELLRSGLRISLEDGGTGDGDVDGKLTNRLVSE